MAPYTLLYPKQLRTSSITDEVSGSRSSVVEMHTPIRKLYAVHVHLSHFDFTFSGSLIALRGQSILQVVYLPIIKHREYRMLL
jgi:hypothetical protein